MKEKKCYFIMQIVSAFLYFFLLFYYFFEEMGRWGDGINVECQANEVTSNWSHEGYGNGAEIRKMRYLMWITPLWPQGDCSAQESRPKGRDGDPRSSSSLAQM